MCLGGVPETNTARSRQSCAQRRSSAGITDRVASIRQDMDMQAAQTMSRSLLGDERGIRLREDTITEDLPTF